MLARCDSRNRAVNHSRKGGGNRFPTHCRVMARTPASCSPRLMTVSAVAIATPTAAAASGPETRPASGKELPPYLQCVPYAREMSGIADLRRRAYVVGPGGRAVPARPHAAGRRSDGVSAASQDEAGPCGRRRPESSIARTVLLNHSNWSPINGRRGQIERNVKAIDVSPDNDWSSVRVWYHPLQAFGKTRWPVHGFIHSGKPRAGQGNRWAAAPTAKPISPKPSKRFAGAFRHLPTDGAKRTLAANVVDKVRHAPATSVRAATPVRATAKRASARTPASAQTQTAGDPFASILAKYD